MSRSIQPIEFVFFDLGNVLASFSVDRACQNVAKRWNVDPEIVRSSLWTSGMQDRFEHGHEDDESFATIARTALGLTIEDAPTGELLDLLSDMFDPVAEMESVVDAVRSSGKKLGILSNTCIAHWRWLQAADYPALRGPFHSVVLSYEIGVMKPHTDIYRHAATAAGVAPAAILFLDDRADNVEAALAHGWQAHQFTDAKSAREVLRWKGVIE
ncbi:MAG: HAD family hydrolase [Planctomycetaceae bacterium]